MSKSNTIKMSLLAMVSVAASSAIAQANGATATESVESNAFVLANLQVYIKPN